MQEFNIVMYGAGCPGTNSGKHHIEQDHDANELTCRQCGWWTGDISIITEILNII